MPPFREVGDSKKKTQPKSRSLETPENPVIMIFWVGPLPGEGLGWDSPPNFM